MSTEDSTLAMAYNGLGLIAWSKGELRESVEAHAHARDLAATAGDDNLRGFATGWLAAAQHAIGDYEQAIAEAQTCSELGRTLGEPRLEIIGLSVATKARYRLGHTVGALEKLRSARCRAAQIRFLYGEIPVLLGIAEIHRLEGDPGAGLQHAEQALALTSRIGSRVSRGNSLIEIAHCQLELGSPESAKDPLEEALELAVTGNHRLVEAGALHVFGLLWTALGDPVAADSAWRRSHEIFAQLGAPDAAEVEALIRR